MSNFDVKLEELNGNVEKLEELATKMQSLITSIQLVAKEIGKDQFWDLRNSLLKEKEQMQIQAQNLVILGTKLQETVNNYKMSENKLINNKTDTKATSDDIVSTSSSVETFETAMNKQFGFSGEEAALMQDAYAAFMANEAYAKLSNQEKINLFFSNMASLQSNYSSNSTLFKLMGDNPSPEEAIEFFNGLGIDGKALQTAVTRQHSETEGYRDFAHECAMYSVFANDTFTKKAAGLVDDIDALVGYKGDIYSKSMGLDDVRSDIAAVNIYNRMLESSDGDIFAAMNAYDSDPNVNPSLEFLQNMGDGDAEKGLSRLEKEIDATSAGTWYLSGDYAGEGGEGHYPGYGYPQYGYDEYGGYSKYGDSNKKTVSDCKEEFLNYIKTESGIQ